jgi:hypothetical protein
VYVILLVPALTPVTNPADETVATPGAEDVHALLTAAVPEPDNCVVEDTHTKLVPVIIGSAFTVAVTAVLDAVVQPFAVAST